MAYQAAAEAIAQLGVADEVATLKLCAANPLPRGKVEAMLKSLETVLVVEEIEPVIETFVRDLSADLDRHARILGKKTGHLPATDELSAEHVAEPLAQLTGRTFAPLLAPERSRQAMTFVAEQITKRPQGALCPGCPEMGTMYALTRALRRVCKEDFVSHGDIGCYERAIYPPWDAMHTIICMGAGPGLAHGMYRVKLGDKQVVQMGDGTFFHAALPELINAVYNGSSFTVVLYDNQCIGATGQQPHPGAFGLTAKRDTTGILSIEKIAAAIGIEPIEVVDPFDLKATRKALERALAAEGVSMVITRRACSILAERALGGRGKVNFSTYEIDPQLCTYMRNGKCRECFDTLGCLAIMRDDHLLSIDPTFCNGCGLCEQVCGPHAIHPADA
ncbi:MAG: 4Fe-4S binding protein [Candidatus Tectomicrobia bacterium]|nr:4Fe-4S binding protein [Candidatus Tectomicrobia bacterium]